MGVATRECLPCGKRIEGEEEDDRIHREALESIPDDAWML